MKLPRFSLLALLAAAPGAALAQSPAYSPAFLPEAHWSLDAYQRVFALGLAPPGTDPADARPTQQDVGLALEHAARRALGTPNEEALRAWLMRFRAELARDPAAGILSVRGSDLRAGYIHHTGALGPGNGYEDGHPYGDWNDPLPQADRRAPFAAGSLQLTPVATAAGRASVVLGESDVAFQEIYAAVAFGPVGLWGGRRLLDFRGGAREGLVLNHARLDGGGIRSARPLALPWALRHAGPVRFSVDVARVDLERTCHDPNQPGDAPRCRGAWFLAMRGSVEPHRRLTLGVTRAAMFGGDGNSDVDAFALFSILIGKHAGEVSELDNQVVSVDASYRPPVERWIPIRTYVEWGFEDSAGAWFNVPGVLAGIELPSLGGVPGLSVAFEGTTFRRSCCGNPIWYRHSVFHDGWVLDGRPLGHRLGGHGQEGAAHASLISADARMRLSASAFHRRRGDENLFAPAREGRSNGGRLSVGAAPWRGIELGAAAEVEDGAGWREVRATVNFRMYPDLRGQ